MPTIVEQLQADAINPLVPISSLLRKVKLVAVKLGLPGVEAWVGSELDGYTGPLPEHRKVYAAPHVLHPRGGWIPLQGDAEWIEKLSEGIIAQSIASLESLLESKKSTFFVSFPPGLKDALAPVLNGPWPDVGQQITRSQIVGLLDSVRTMVLDWALELERQGILGSEIGFDADEKKLAHDKQVHIHIGSIANFTGSLNAEIAGENSRLNIGSNDQSKNRK